MRTYSLLQFLSEPISQILNNEDDYRFTVLKSENVLLESKNESIDRINIPIIQRDYVQGLKEKEELLKGFLEDLFKALETGKEIKLDFIYGSLNKKCGNVFLPLDGQQRLTTLYLLHWYIIKKESSREEFESKHVNILSKFSYETRDTSRRFFQELIAFNFTGSPKESIKKSYWYNDHFSLDPTVKACLNALETIHKIYSISSEKGNLLEKLNDNLIVFYILPMDQFRLTDELYIKLNARGKVLSPFENFKADIIGFLKTEKEFDIEILYKDILFKKYDVLGNKFDNDWSNLFWKQAKIDKSEKKSVDSYFFRFMHRILINQYLLDFKVSAADKDKINNDKTYINLKNREENLKYFNFDLYQDKNLVSKKSVNELEVILDFYHKHNEKISQLIFPHKSSHSGWSIYKDEYSMDDRIIFDAVNQFILYNHKKDFDECNFKNWMRVVWNLISDPDNRSIEANKTVMKVVRDIAKYSGTILESLSNNELDDYINSLKNIYKLQLEEEKVKALLILNNLLGNEWREVIEEAESHDFFEGNIGFLLSGILSASQLRERFNIAVKVLKEKAGKDNYTLTRFIISQIDKFQTLDEFKYLQNDLSWKTNLRRTEIVKQEFLKLIELNNLTDINAKIESSIKSDSILLEANTKQKIAHKNLYFDKDFHVWMQNDGTQKLKWKDSRLYIVRPSAWYSKVMIDGFRNELITKLIDRWKFDEVTNRCGNSNYYMIEKFDYFKTYEDVKITFHFDIENKLHIGLRAELNTGIENINQRTDGWIECHSFDIDEIQYEDEIDNFIEKIEKEIQQNHDNLIKNKLLNIKVALS